MPTYTSPASSAKRSDFEQLPFAICSATHLVNPANDLEPRSTSSNSYAILLRDFASAVACVSIGMVAGALSGLGLLIGFDAVVPPDHIYVGFAILILLPPLTVLIGIHLQRSAGFLPSLAGNVVLLIGTLLVGFSLGCVGLYMVISRGDFDFGPIYVLSGLGTIFGLGIVFRGSRREALNRQGTIIIVLGAALATWAIEMLSKDSHVAARLDLRDGVKVYAEAVCIALLIIVPAATAVFLARIRHGPDQNGQLQRDCRIRS